MRSATSSPGSAIRREPCLFTRLSGGRRGLVDLVAEAGKDILVMSAQRIWLASYPRSGNTLLRTVLYHCFGLASASIYPDDLEDNTDLESFTGHIEHDAHGMVRFPDGAIPLFKTHQPPPDDQGAIYVVRDGRAACVSLWEFRGRKFPMDKIISGQHHFGTWANHLSQSTAWNWPQRADICTRSSDAKSRTRLNDSGSKNLLMDTRARAITGPTTGEAISVAEHSVNAERSDEPKRAGERPQKQHADHPGFEHAATLRAGSARFHAVASHTAARA